MPLKNQGGNKYVRFKFPHDPNEQVDNDQDGIGNNTALDDDNDQIPDVWENQHGFDKNNANDAGYDADNDGLTNLQEFQHGTDPHKADTDGDGWNDKAELDAGTDPLKPDSTNPPAVNDATVIIPIIMDLLLK